MKTFLWLCFGFLLLAAGPARADQVEMQNGDRYMAKVLAMTNATLVLQSEILGTFTVPRDKVARILLGAAALTNTTHAPAGEPISASSQKLALPGANRGAQRNPQSSATGKDAPDQKQIIQQIQEEFLAGADPAAKSKYNEMVSGFLSGKLNVSDIRAEAKSAAEQLRAARKDLGEDAGFALDGYLAILDSFLKETGSTADTAAKPAKPAQKPKPEAEE